MLEGNEMATSSDEYANATFEITVDKSTKVTKDRNTAALLYMKATYFLDTLHNQWENCSDTSNQNVLKDLMNSCYRTFSYQKIKKAAKSCLRKLQHVFLIVNDSPMRINCWRMTEEVKDVITSCDTFFYNIATMKHKTESLAKFTIKKEKTKADEQIQGYFSSLNKLHDNILSPLLSINYTVPPVDIIKGGLENSKRFFQLKKSRYGALIEPKSKGKPHIIDKRNKSPKAHLADFGIYVLKKESKELVDSINAVNVGSSVKQVKQVYNDGILEAPLKHPVTRPYVDSIKVCRKSLDTDGEIASKKIDCKFLQQEGFGFNPVGTKRSYPYEFEVEVLGKGCKRFKNMSKVEYVPLGKHEKTKKASTQNQNSRKRKLLPRDGKNEEKKVKLLDS